MAISYISINFVPSFFGNCGRSVHLFCSICCSIIPHIIDMTNKEVWLVEISHVEGRQIVVSPFQTSCFALRCITSCFSFRYNKQLIAQLVGRHEDFSHPEKSFLPRASPSGDMDLLDGTKSSCLPPNWAINVYNIRFSFVRQFDRSILFACPVVFSRVSYFSYLNSQNRLYFTMFIIFHFLQPTGVIHPWEKRRKLRTPSRRETFRPGWTVHEKADDQLPGGVALRQMALSTLTSVVWTHD